jgi:hypothetical protein
VLPYGSFANKVVLRPVGFFVAVIGQQNKGYHFMQIKGLECGKLTTQIIQKMYFC